MNTCPNCGKVAGLHSSILQGCMCQYAMQAPPQRTWQGLTEEDKKQMFKEANYHWEMTTGEYAERIGQLTEAKLKERNA
jgi:hypothetical protein